MSVEILETMDECIVAKKAAKMIRKALTRENEILKSVEVDSSQRSRDLSGNRTAFPLNHYWGPLDLVGSEMDISFPFEMGDLEEELEPFSSLCAPSGT